jgi:uncharacterized protein
VTGDHKAIARLDRRVRSYGAARAVVAFSGGVDSALVLAVAARALGAEAVTAVTAVSASYPAGELEQARTVAAGLGVKHRTVHTGEVQREAYARNDGDRCFHCKMELYATLRRLTAEQRRPATVMMAGANADDARDFRPGLRAARQQGIRNPLLEEGLGKIAVRGAARVLGLGVADKPALACLSSRVAFGVRIDAGLLGRIDRAERAVRGLGFEAVRVRHFGRTASIEVEGGDVSRLLRHPSLDGLLGELKEMGWDEVTVHPDGYRMGRMNETLDPQFR